MFRATALPADSDRPAAYRLLLEQAEALIGPERDRTANAANLASLPYWTTLHGWLRLPQWRYCVPKLPFDGATARS